MNKSHQISLFESSSEDSRTFFTRKRSWSASKHRIILRYIQAQCYNLGGSKSYQSRHMNYIDAFAGEGKYDEGFGIEDFLGTSNFWQKYDVDILDTDGSPLIALKLAKAFKEEGRVNLRCFFTEADKRFHQNLIKNCQLALEGSELDYKVYPRGEFGKFLPEILTDLKLYPSLFFVDTFGVKGFNFEQIRLIGDYLSKHKGELFLLFHNIQVARHAGQSTAKSQEPRSVKASQTYYKNLTEFLGPNSDRDWKSKWMELKNTPQAFERWALGYFMSRIFKETNFKGVASFEIKEEYNDPRPQYSIVACSNHPQKAFGEFLNEFFAEENRLLFYKDENKNFISTSSFLEREWNKQVEERKHQIKPILIQILKDKVTGWIEVRKAITHAVLVISRNYDLGYLKRPEYRKMIVALYKEGVIEARCLGKKNQLTLDSEIRAVQ